MCNEASNEIRNQGHKQGQAGQEWQAGKTSAIIEYKFISPDDA